MGSVTYCENIFLASFQEEYLEMMGPIYHIDMYWTHSQSFMHCHSSVVIVIAKCVLSVALGGECCFVAA